MKVIGFLDSSAVRSVGLQLELQSTFNIMGLLCRTLTSKDDSEARLAILIDADNTPYESIPLILDRSHRFGRAIIKRAYGDWSRPELHSWDQIFREYAIKAMHQPQFTTGKNSTDSAMIIDAMDILNAGGADVFMLVTSDSDFTALSTRIREHGLRVVGVGRETTSASFVKGCDEFLLIENLVRDSELVDKEKVQVVTKKDEKLKDVGKVAASEGAALLAKAVLNVVDENGDVLGAELGAMLRKLDPKFSPQNFDVTRLSEFVALYPNILKRTPRRSGVDVIYQSLVNR